MSVTVTISRRASAFKTNEGIFYALFETTYPQDASDPKPLSQCVAFGKIADVTRWIYKAMAACQSGLLVGANGPLDALDYERFWQHALRRPDLMFTQPIWIKASKHPKASIPTESDVWYDGDSLPFATRVLREYGYPDIAVRVGQGEEVILDLHRDALVLAGLYGGVKDGQLAPWRIIECHGKGEGDPSLAPTPRAALARVGRTTVYGIDKTARLCALIEGRKALLGTREELLHDFIAKVASEREVASFGAGARSIQTFRECLAGMSTVFSLPSTVTVVIRKERLLGTLLYRERYEAIEKALAGRAKPVEFGLKVKVATLRALDLLSLVADLPSVCLDFQPALRRRAPTPAPATRTALAA